MTERKTGIYNELPNGFEARLPKRTVIDILTNYKLTKKGRGNQVKEYIPGLFKVLDKFEAAEMEYGFGVNLFVPLKENDILVLAEATKVLYDNDKFFGDSDNEFASLYPKTFNTVLKSYERAKGSMSAETQMRVKELGL